MERQDNSGDAAGETSTTGPSKSGTGNFGGSNGNDITVNNNNHEWIDGDNRAGRTFFLKNRNSRIGLAKLREKAIATAQTWAAGTGYEPGALVKYKSRYWFALSANTDEKPNRLEQDQWFDLGTTRRASAPENTLADLQVVLAVCESIGATVDPLGDGKAVSALVTQGVHVVIHPPVTAQVKGHVSAT